MTIEEEAGTEVAVAVAAALAYLVNGLETKTVTMKVKTFFHNGGNKCWYQCADESRTDLDVWSQFSTYNVLRTNWGSALTCVTVT